MVPKTLSGAAHAIEMLFTPSVMLLTNAWERVCSNAASAEPSTLAGKLTTAARLSSFFHLIFVTQKTNLYQIIHYPSLIVPWSNPNRAWLCAEILNCICEDSSVLGNNKTAIVAFFVKKISSSCAIIVSFLETFASFSIASAPSAELRIPLHCWFPGCTGQALKSFWWWHVRCWFKQLQGGNVMQ